MHKKTTRRPDITKKYTQEEMNEMMETHLPLSLQLFSTTSPSATTATLTAVLRLYPSLLQSRLEGPGLGALLEWHAELKELGDGGLEVLEELVLVLGVHLDVLLEVLVLDE